jgi:GntR family transcriptional regulator/MocR family aminotransferase
MRAVYEERQGALVEAAGRELAGLLEIRASEGGMHLVGWLPRGVSDVAAAGKAAAHGVIVRALSTCSVRKLSPGGLILGYAALSIPQIREGVKNLAHALS